MSDRDIQALRRRYSAGEVDVKPALLAALTRAGELVCHSCCERYRGLSWLARYVVEGLPCGDCAPDPSPDPRPLPHLGATDGPIITAFATRRRGARRHIWYTSRGSGPYRLVGACGREYRDPVAGFAWALRSTFGSLGDSCDVCAHHVAIWWEDMRAKDLHRALSAPEPLSLLGRLVSVNRDGQLSFDIGPGFVGIVGGSDARS